MIERLRRDVPTLPHDLAMAPAIRCLIDSGLAALPVTGRDGRYSGVFGEREVLAAVFPSYLGTLSYAGFVPDDLDEVFERRSEALLEPIDRYINREHVELPADASNASLAETFLHHRVLVVPIVERGQVRGVVTRSDFFRWIAEQVLDG